MTDAKALYSQELVLILTGWVLDGCHGTAHACIVYFQLCVEEKRHHPRLAALHCRSHSYKRCGTSKAAHAQRRKMGGSVERQVWPAESLTPLSLILSSSTRGSSCGKGLKTCCQLVPVVENPPRSSSFKVSERPKFEEVETSVFIHVDSFKCSY